MKNLVFIILFYFLNNSVMAEGTGFSCPTVNGTTQSFCERISPTVSNLVATDQGSGITWYSSNTAATSLDPSTPLADGIRYYAGAPDGSCKGSRVSVVVQIQDAPNAGSNLNLTFSSDDASVDLFTLIGPNAYGVADAGGYMDPPLRSGTTVFDPSLDGIYSGRRRYRYTVLSGNETCGNSVASIYITINPQANSSHRLIHFGDTEEEAYYNQNNYIPASADEGILFNIWGEGPLEVGSVYKLNINGLERYYFVNNVYLNPELSPTYTLPADTPIEKFIVTDPDGIGRTIYTSPVFSYENYVYSRTPQIPVSDINSLKYTDEVIEQITYFDGLGRGKQNVGIRAGGSGEDIITPVKFDDFGREVRTFLPYARKTLAGEIHPEVIEAEGIYGTSVPYMNFYQTLKYEFTANPYSEKLFESSSLNRVLKQAAPGNDWKLGGGREIEFAYQTNILDEVRLFRVDFIDGDTASPNLVVGTEEYYGAGEIYKNITRDENHTGTTKNNTIEEFLDKQGRVVLKRTYADIGNQSQVSHDTYYVYDDYGNLTFVLPPKIEGSMATLTDIINNIAALGYQYKYDHRNRLIEKKVPGKEWEYIVYNDLDQPVLTQDALLKAEGKWLYTKYDAFGRVTSTGIYTNTAGTSQLQMQSIIDSFYSGSNPPKQYEEKSGSVYTNRSFPTTGIAVLTENFYDEYNFDKSGIVVPAYNSYGRAIHFDKTKGLSTGSRVKVLETALWITSVIGYDDKGRAIWTAGKNEFLGTEDISHINIDFVGKLIAQTNIHIKSGQPTTIEDLYSYDHMGRQLTNSQSINGGSSELVAKNKYDELGVLIKKSVGGSISNQNTIPQSVETEFEELIHLEVRENGEILKISGGTSEAGIAKTTKTFKGDGYVEFSPQTSDKIFNVGLTYTDPTNPNYGYYYYANVVRNYIKIYEGGSNLEYSMDYQVNVVPGDRLTVEREGSTVLYKKNGETYYISSQPSYGEIRGEARVRNVGQIMHYMKVVDLEENTKPLQIINYTYNVRGWLKKINEPENLGEDLFNFEINYNNPKAGATPLFNGNISETHWNTKSENNTNNPVSDSYIYSYDALNRITGAIDNTGNYNLGGITYDKMGNLLSLQRQGHLDANVSLFGNMDQLKYSYSLGNQLSSVEDLSTSLEGFKDGNKGSLDYAYDFNGNLTSDANKGIQAGGITYNHLNLPTSITLPGGTITYTYDATGAKLQKKVAKSGNLSNYTFYAGKFVYKRTGDSGSGTLEFFGTPEGYVSYDGGQFNYVYNYLDHLGNVRLSYTDANQNNTNPVSLQVIQEKNYYPFGLTHQGYNSGVSSLGSDDAKKYLFNGVELNQDLGLNLYEMDFRSYDAAIGRFTLIDPLSEQMRRFSPYNFGWDNPLIFVDPDGLFGDYYDKEGNYLGNDGIDDNKVYEVSQMPAVSSDIEGSGELKIEYIGQLEDVFITGDAPSDERIQSLHPAIRMKATNFIKEANADSENTLIRVAQGYRTFAEQDALYARGRTEDGSIVTNARGGFSNHNFGLAFDIVGITDGKIDYNLNWSNLSTLGKAHGFEWGGDWKFTDKPHFQNLSGNTFKSLREKYNSGNLINGYINLK